MVTMALGMNMIAAVLLLMMAPSQNLSKGNAIEVKIHCEDWGSIHIDEHRRILTYPHKPLWTGNISGNSRLIAIYCSNFAGLGGLIASIGERVVTDETWRCSNDTSTIGGSAIETDDSREPWDNAYVIPPEDLSDSWSTFPGRARWIWADDVPSTRSICRMTLGISVVSKIRWFGKLFADGQFMYSQRNTQRRFIIPRTTRVVAIEGWKNDSDSFFVEAIFSNRYGTDTSWRCTGNKEHFWETVDFDDSHWDQAVDRGNNDLEAHAEVRKIWTATESNSYAYCRGHIECGCEHLCEPDENEFDFRCTCFEGYVVGEDGFSCESKKCREQNSGCEDICVNIASGHKCECSDPRYELSRDMHSCINIDECERNLHNCSGTCKDTEDGFTCNCPAGFTLQEDQASCSDINECEETNGNCTHGCFNTYGSYMCNCSDGYLLADDEHACLLSGEGGGVDPGMIAGIVAAFMTITIVAIVLVIFLIRRRQRHNSKETGHDTLPHVYYNVGRDNLAEDTARAQPSEPSHVYYNAGRVSRLDGVPYENVPGLQRKTNEAQEALEHEASDESATVQKHVNRSEHTEGQVGTGNVSHEPPHVYYNVGRVHQNYEIPYEDVGGIRARITEKETDLSTQGQGQNEYSSLSRETREDGDASPYTQLA